MDITDLSVALFQAYEEILNSSREDYEESVGRFSDLLRRVSEEFGVEQFNLARYIYYQDREFMRETYLEVLKEDPEIVEVSAGGDAPVMMCVDMMDCGSDIAVIETNGFTCRGFSCGGVELIVDSLEDAFEDGGKRVFAIGYPLEDGRSRKSDDLLFEKLLYSGALAMRMRERGRVVKVVRHDGSMEADYDLLILLLPKSISKGFEVRGGRVYLEGLKIDCMSDNLVRTRGDLTGYVRSINSNGWISDSKHLTYKAIENYLRCSERRSPMHPLYSHRINVGEISGGELESKALRAAEEVAARCGKILVKPDKGSGGCGIGVCGNTGEVLEKVRSAEAYAPDGSVLVMECAPIVPVDLDSQIRYEGKIWRAGDLLKEIIEEIHGYALEGEIPDDILRGRHAVDFRFYVARIRGRDIMKRYGVENVRGDGFYLAPQAAILRMAPGIWVDDPKALSEDPTIVKSNISQEVEGRGAKTEYGILRFFVAFEGSLAAFGYRGEYKDFMVSAFDAVKATIQYHESLSEERSSQEMWGIE
jgi:hypothetical protein